MVHGPWFLHATSCWLQLWPQKPIIYCYLDGILHSINGVLSDLQLVFRAIAVHDFIYCISFSFYHHKTIMYPNYCWRIGDFRTIAMYLPCSIRGMIIYMFNHVRFSEGVDKSGTAQEPRHQSSNGRLKGKNKKGKMTCKVVPHS